MSQFYLYDDRRSRDFEPFALSRPLGEVRAGALLIRERWERVLGLACGGFLGAPHLADFQEFDAPRAVAEAVLPAGSVVVNSRCVPSLQPVGAADVIESGGRVAAVRLDAATPSAHFADGSVDLEDLTSAGWNRAMAGGWWLEAPWDLVRHLVAALAEDIPLLGSGLDTVTPSGVTVLGAHPHFIATGARVEPLVVFDCTSGPVLVAPEASVAAFTRLVGPCYVAPGAQVLGGKVAASAIGEQCRVHGEVNSVVFIGHTNKGHDGFVGHSVLGRWVNLGAATVTSNLKNTYGPVQLWTPGGMQSTGLQFLGTLFGDHAKTAIGTRLTTGCVVGAGANVVGSGLTPKVVPPFRWGAGEDEYDPERFVTVAERMMARRGVVPGEGERRHLRRVFAARWTSAS